jgi:hypothetical protein
MAISLEQRREYYRKNKERINAYARAWKKKNPEKAKAAGRRSERKRKLKRYGLTPETYEQMFQEQNNKCAICLGDNSSSKRDWHIDHCHETGVVRGILCHHCNIGLGQFRDNVEHLKNAIAYLERQ